MLGWSPVPSCFAGALACTSHLSPKDERTPYLWGFAQPALLFLLLYSSRPLHPPTKKKKLATRLFAGWLLALQQETHVEMAPLSYQVVLGLCAEPGAVAAPPPVVLYLSYLTQLSAFLPLMCKPDQRADLEQWVMADCGKPGWAADPCRAGGFLLQMTYSRQIMYLAFVCGFFSWF